MMTPGNQPVGRAWVYGVRRLDAALDVWMGDSALAVPATQIPKAASSRRTP